VSYRISQLSPLASTSIRITFHSPWRDDPWGENAWSECPKSLRNVQFLRSWLEYDSEIEEPGSRRGIHWYKVFGLLLIAGICVSFWTGVAWLVMHF
jgi:hypothetical protein